jgi:hypothetical protein
MVEEYGLLPKNHFGARKRRSAPQALAILQERIYEAWRHRKVLSVISFDVKGAYNGVKRDFLLNRLRQRRIPEKMIRWIDSFCSDRQASIVVNGVTSPMVDLPQAGLPQGSPLSPILFLFFNADLVQSTITGQQGSIAFVDDFTAWVTGDSADENIEKLQRTILPKVERWEKMSGAMFEASKTSLIHFTRTTSRLGTQCLRFKGIEIESSTTAKLLGVVLDQ